MRSVRRIVLVALAVAVFLPLSGPAFAGEAAGEAVRGTIQREDEESGEQVPVEGVSITVSTADGEEVGVVTTDAEGAYALELPGPGDYTATIDVESLPEGVALRNPDVTSLEFSIRPNQSRPLLFPLGEGSGGGGSGVGGQALALLVSGIRFGLIIAMCAIGLSLIYGTTGLTNFAHGELVTFGAIAAYLFNVTLGVHLIPAAIIAVAVGGLFGAGLDRVLWRPLRHRGTGLIAMLVISIGLGILLRYLFLYQFGGRTRPYGQYAVMRSLDLGPVSVTPADLVSIIVSILVLFGVGLVLQRTRIGKAMRAVADNRDLAESSGVDAERVVLFVWFFGGALAALGGILLGLAEQVGWQMGFQLLLLMFAGVTLGGIGTAYGALLGSLVIGIVVQVSTLVVPNDLRIVIALAALIFILLVRPQGILGQAERVG